VGSIFFGCYCITSVGNFSVCKMSQLCVIAAMHTLALCPTLLFARRSTCNSVSPLPGSFPPLDALVFSLLFTHGFITHTHTHTHTQSERVEMLERELRELQPRPILMPLGISQVCCCVAAIQSHAIQSHAS